MESFRAVADQKVITLTFRVDSLQEDCLFDANKWATIITNLLTNTLKFTPKDGWVTIDLTTVGQAAIRLIITGIGIAAEKLPPIFDRFYQVDDTHTYEGTGIGLVLVKELTDVLAGTIAVESWRDKGTMFTRMLPVLPALADADIPAVRLPAYPPNELTYVHDRSENEQPDLPGNLLLLLMIEDNAELRNFIADELAVSYRILTATIGREGISANDQYDSSALFSNFFSHPSNVFATCPIRLTGSTWPTCR